MLVGTDRGRSYAEDEYTAWMKAAGFTGVEQVKLPGSTSLMIKRPPDICDALI